jgi:hypothetical protein
MFQCCNAESIGEERSDIGIFLIAGSVIALTMTRNPVDLSEPSDGRCDTKGMALLPAGR